MNKEIHPIQDVSFVRGNVKIDWTFITLLGGVEEFGSIAMSAREVGISYSLAHSRIRAAEQACGGKLVENCGRYAAAGSQLTSLAQDMIKSYKTIAHSIDKGGAAFIETYLHNVVE